MTDPSIRHTALAVCLGVLLLGLPIAHALAQEPYPSAMPGTWATDWAGIWVDANTTFEHVQTVEDDGADRVSIASRFERRTGWTGDHTSRALCADAPWGEHTSLDLWNVLGSGSYGAHTFSETSVTCPAGHPYFVGIGVTGWIRDNGTTQHVDGFEAYLYIVDPSVLGRDEGGSYTMCPDSEDLYPETFASWDGQVLTAIVRVDKDVWEDYTAGQPDLLRTFPESYDWQAIVGDGSSPQWADYPTGLGAYRYPAVAAGVGPDGGWIGAYLLRHDSDPAILDDLDGDGVDDRHVVVGAVPAVDDDGLINPTCNVAIELQDADPSDPSTSTPGTTVPPAEDTDGDGIADEPGVIGGGTEPDCSIFRLLSCLKWLLVPSEQSMREISQSLDHVDVIPFSYALDFSSWLHDLKECGSGLGCGDYLGVAPDPIGFSFEPITGQNNTITLLSESGGGCTTSVQGGCENPAPATRILRGMRWLIEVVVWAGTGLAFFRIIGRGGFSLGASKGA